MRPLASALTPRLQKLLGVVAIATSLTFVLNLSPAPVHAAPDAAKPPVAPPSQAPAAKPLANADIKRFVEIGLSESDIIRFVQTMAGDYELTPAKLDELKTAGVSIKVALEMQAASIRKTKEAQDAALRSLYGPDSVPKALPVANPDANADALSLSVKTVDLGTQSLGTQSPAKEVVITNTGASNVPLSPLRILPMPNAPTTPPFQITDNGCGAKLAPGDNCKFKIVFAPFSFALSKDTNKPESVLPYTADLPIITDPGADLVSKQQLAEHADVELQETRRKVTASQKQVSALNCAQGDLACSTKKASFEAELVGLQAGLAIQENNTREARQALADAVLKATAQTKNKITLSGMPKRWTYPFTSFVAGLDAAAASSQDVQQTYFVQASLTAPLSFKTKESDPLERRLWVFLNPRITSLPFQDSNAAVSSLNANADFLSGLLKGKISGVTQGFDFTAGLEWACPYLCRKPREGAGWTSEFQGTTVRARFSNTFVFGIGASTPFSNQKTIPPAFQVNPSILERFGCVTNPSVTFPVPKAPFCSDLLDAKGMPTAKTNITFLFPDRSRFFYKYFIGVRLKTFFFNPDVQGDCRNSQGKLHSGGCEMPFNVFPGVVDLTVGKDAVITGGRLSKWLFRIDVVHPIPFVSGFYIFGSTYMGFGKTVETPPITLVPVLPPAATDANTERVILPRPNRDIYRIGLGVDLLHLLNKGGGKPGGTTATPPATTPAADAAATPKS